MGTELRVLGQVELWVDGRLVEVGHARQRCVLAVLLVEANRVVTMEQLLERVWADRLPYQARRVVSNYVSRLRRVLAPAGDVAVVRRGGGYVLEVAPEAVDLHLFRGLVQQARGADDVRALGLLEEAAGLWRGEPFAGLDTPWLGAVRAGLERERVAARLDRVDVALRCGRHAEVLPELFALAEQEDVDERVSGQFMLALHRAGRTADALAHYRQLRARLVEQLGTEPGTALQVLHQRILDTDPALAPPAASATRGTAEQPVAIPRLRGGEDTSLREKARRATSPSPVAQSMPPRRPSRLRLLTAFFGVLFLVFTTAHAATPDGRDPMTGLYNILMVPFDGYPSLERTVALEMEQWVHDEPALQTRGPSGVERARDLERLAVAHNADVVLTGRLDTSGDRWSVVIDVLVTERVFAETPEFVGHHELTLTEPADVIRTNIELSQDVAGDVVEYVRAVVAFVRGLGRYALDDFAGAERQFRTAQQDLAMLTKARSPSVATRAEVVQLMLANTAGRAGRPEDAVRIFRQVLEQHPGYLRASVGLAEALRAGGCRRNDQTAMNEALKLYSAALTGASDALLEMKTRLGLGSTYQCLSAAGTPHWEEADGQYATVLRMQAAAGLTGEAGRQALRLAAEARAGQASTAWRQGRLDSATTGYEEAIALLHAIGVSRTTIHDQELTFLRNLRDVHRARNATAQADAVEERIRLAEGRR